MGESFSLIIFFLADLSFRSADGLVNVVESVDGGQIVSSQIRRIFLIIVSYLYRFTLSTYPLFKKSIKMKWCLAVYEVTTNVAIKATTENEKRSINVPFPPFS